MSESKHRNWLQLIGYYFEFSKRAEQRVRDDQRKYGSMSYTELAAKYTIAHSKFCFAQRNYDFFKSLVLITIATFYFSLPILYVPFVVFHKNHFKQMLMIKHQQVVATMMAGTVTIFLALIVIIVLSVFINNLMANQESELNLIREARDLKKGVIEKERRYEFS